MHFRRLDADVAPLDFTDPHPRAGPRGLAADYDEALFYHWQAARAAATARHKVCAVGQAGLHGETGCRGRGAPRPLRHRDRRNGAVSALQQQKKIFECFHFEEKGTCIYALPLKLSLYPRYYQAFAQPLRGRAT